MAEIAARLGEVRGRISAAAARAGRPETDVTLVAVGKTHPPAAIAAAVDAGIGDIGESRVRELLAKQEALAGRAVRWHMVGVLQRNKAREVVGTVTLIHSIDSGRLAETVAARAAARGVTQDVLLQVNVSGERTKHGVRPDEALAAAARMGRLAGLRLRGLMTIPPAQDPEASRRAYAALRALRARIAAEYPDATELSMGMSDDFEIAIEEGATLVRIGTAIFGPRAA